MDTGPIPATVEPQRRKPWNARRSPRQALSLLTRLVLDGAPPIALAIAAAHELAYDRLGFDDWIYAQALAWPLIVRRRFPRGVLAGSLAIALVCWAQHEIFSSYLSVLFALHAVAAQRPRVEAFLAAALVELGALLVSWRFAPSRSLNDAVILLTALVLTALFLGTAQRVQRQYLSVLEERARQLERERDQQALLSAAQERTRIARELHDIVAHSVSVMVTLSEGAAVRAGTNTAQAQQTMRQVAATGREALSELRTVVSVLRGAGAGERTPQPTLGALAALVADVRRTGLPVSLTVTGDVEDLPEALQINVYRIIQEGLTNVLKHASGVTRASVTVASSPERVDVRVQDDGRPRRGGPGRAELGNGIPGMRERAELFGGQLSTGWSGEGWLVAGTLDPSVAQL